MADGGYIAMDDSGYIDLGEFDLGQFGPTSANGGGYFTNPQLPMVNAPAPVDAPGNLANAFGMVQGMQQPIPDPGPSYEAARAQRMQALMEDLGVLDQGVAAAQQQVAAQRARPLNFGNLPIGAEANALFGRAYDFAEGAIGQGRISAEAKLRAQANQALDQILSGNYQAGYQGQVQQALDLPNQALTAAGQFNQVGLGNQSTELQTLLENSANRRAEMNAQQAQQLAQFGEAGTDARFRLGLVNSNNQLGVQQAGDDRRQYYNAVFQDLLANNQYFRTLPLEQQKIAVEVAMANQNNALTARGQDVQMRGQDIGIQQDSVAFQRQKELNVQQAQLQSERDRLQAEINNNPNSPDNQYKIKQLSLLDSQIAENNAQAEQAKAKIATYTAKGLTTTAQQNQYDKDSSVVEQLKPRINSLTANPSTPDEYVALWASEDLLNGKSTGRQRLAQLVDQVSPPLWTQSYSSKLKKTVWVNPAAKDPNKPKDSEITTVDPNKDIRAQRAAVAAQYTALYDSLAGQGMGSAGLADLKALYAARKASPAYALSNIGAAIQGVPSMRSIIPAGLKG